MDITVAEELFILPSQVIKRLREIMPSMQNRIAGAAQFDAIGDISKIASPSLFVLLTDNTSETLSLQSQLRQKIFHGFDILLVLDSTDTRKQESEEMTVKFKGALLYALNGWLPEGADKAASPLQFVGDIWRGTDRSRYLRVFRFLQDYVWSTSDNGYGTDIPVILEEFNSFVGQITSDGSELEGNVIVPFEVTLDV